MFRRVIAPASYTQGPEILSEPDGYRTLSGERAVLAGGTTALSVAENEIRTGLEATGIDVSGVERGVDACTYETIGQLAERVEATGADVVVGVGGGVALDASKAAAERTSSELAVVPTVASTDAPCSSVAVVYDDAGAFDGYVSRRRNPEAVVVDTQVVAEAPVEFLRYGMGDAFATRFEAETVARANEPTHAGGTGTDAALTLARRSFRNLSDFGPDAVAAVERDAVTPAVERVVETNTLLSGVGFESAGLAGAHAFSKGFSRAGVKAPHGLLVAFGAIAQLVLEGRESDVLREALAVYRSLGLETTLSELDVGEDGVERVAARACDEDTTMSNVPGEVTPAAAADALRTADQLVRSE